MELVESYLNEVGRFLPESRRIEILAELRDDIVEELSMLVEEEGRGITEQDERDVLGRFGHPFKVAGRYQPTKYLIGPEWYPVFVHTLKVVFALAIAIWVAVALIASQLSGFTTGPFSVLGNFIEMCIWVVMVVALVFIAIEYSGERMRWYDKWEPQSLSKGALNGISRQDVITNLISEGFFLMWWNDVVVISDWIPADADFMVPVAPAWSAFFLPLNVIFAVMFVLHLYALLRGVWQRFTLLIEIAGNTALLAIGMLLVLNGPLLELQGLGDGTVNNFIQNVVKTTLVIIMATCAWDIWLAVKGFRGIQLLRNS